MLFTPEPHLCAALHQRYKVRGRAQMHLHFAFAQKIERAAKSATLPYAFYIFEVLMSPLRFGRMSVLHPIYGMVHRNAISDFHSSVESDTFASSEV